MLCSRSVASAGAARSVTRLCPVSSASHRSKHVWSSTAVALQLPSAVVSSRPEEFASSTSAVVAQHHQPARHQLQSVAQEGVGYVSEVDDERLLTLQLLNQHTEQIACLGCSIVPAAVIPAGVDASIWKQQVVDMYASHKHLSTPEAQKQLDVILANPQETPCFIACGRDPSVPGCKAVCGLVVGSITYSSGGTGAKTGAVSTDSKQSNAFNKQKQLQIDAFSVHGLNHHAELNRGGSSQQCTGCPEADCCPGADCCTCSSSSIGRTLLLWLMGEAGCFDDTDAKIALSAWDFKHDLLCLFSQLGFEPWHMPRGPPPAAPSNRSIGSSQVGAGPHAGPALGYSLLSHTGLDAAAGPLRFPAACSQPRVVAVCCAAPPASRRQGSVFRGATSAAGAMQSVGTSHVRVSSSAGRLLQRASGPARVGGSKRASVAANAHRMLEGGYTALAKQTNDGVRARPNIATLTEKLPNGSGAVEAGRVVVMYRKAGLLTQLKKLPDSYQPLSSNVSVDRAENVPRIASNVVAWKRE